MQSAIQELKAATQRNIDEQPATVRLPPVWSKVHAREEQRLTIRPGTMKVPPIPNKHLGFPSHEAALASCISNASMLSSPCGSLARVHGSDGSQLEAPLNSTSTHLVGSDPVKPGLTNNLYSSVGNYSMFGSQVLLAAPSSVAAFAITSWLLLTY